MLFDAGVTTRMGRSRRGGNTVTDYKEDETKRQISVSAALAPLEWKGHKLNIIDTPGFIDFQADVRSALSVVEGRSCSWLPWPEWKWAPSSTGAWQNRTTWRASSSSTRCAART